MERQSRARHSSIVETSYRKYQQTLKSGRGDQNKDFEMRNLLPETPWFDAVEENENPARDKNDNRRMSGATLTPHCVEPRCVRT
jgi:hypothetical protein